MVQGRAGAVFCRLVACPVPSLAPHDDFWCKRICHEHTSRGVFCRHALLADLTSRLRILSTYTLQQGVSRRYYSAYSCAHG